MSSSDGITDDISNTIDFFEHGSVEVIANDMFAQIELGLDLSSSQSLASLPISLPTIPLTPFEVCFIFHMEKHNIDELYI
ncbi:hypothetical protein AWENTII_012787 [Aspergillus wentii]